MATEFDVKGLGRVRIDPGAVARYLKSPGGPVLRRFLILGDRVKILTVARLRAGFPRDFLAPTIVKRVVIASNGPHVLVGSDKVRTQPHPIDGNPLLVFFWPRAGRVVYLRHVNHPGSDFGRYLEEKLVESLLALRGIGVA